MIVERIAASGQLIPLVFMQDAVAASQTDVQLPVAEVNAGAGNGVDEYVMPFDGEIVAISARLSAAATAGSLTVGPTIDGTEKTALQQTITTSQSARAVARRDSIPFSAGARIGAEITSSGTWDGTAADLCVVVWVLVKLADSGY